MEQGILDFGFWILEGWEGGEQGEQEKGDRRAEIPGFFDHP